MKIKVPDYFLDFKCIADKCTDSCCIGWEIDIDERTRAKYAELNEPIGAEIREKTQHGCFPLQENGRCAFLDYTGLCRIICSLNDSYLCDICREHPRYYGIGDGVLEGGIGLACPEAARIILSIKKLPKLVYTEREVNYFDEDDYATLGEYIRDKLYNSIFEYGIPEVVGIYKAYANVVAEAAFDAISTNQTFVTLPAPTYEAVSEDEIHSLFSHTLSLLSECEALSDNWYEILKKAGEVEVNSLDDGMVRSLIYYFTHRYAREGIEDMSVGGRILFAPAAALVTAAIAQVLGDNVEAAVFFSKNIEYSIDNINLVLDVLSEIM